METYESSVSAEQLERALNKSVFSVNGKTGDVSLGASDVKAVPLPSVAEVGQTIVVTAVDENGVPTAWEAVPLLSGVPDWKLVYEATLEEDVTGITISQDMNGNLLEMRGFFLYLYMPATPTTGYLRLYINGDYVTYEASFALTGVGSTSAPYELSVEMLVADDNSAIIVDGWCRTGTASIPANVRSNGAILQDKKISNGVITSIEHENGVVLPAGTLIKLYKTR